MPIKCKMLLVILLSVTAIAAKAVTNDQNLSTNTDVKTSLLIQNNLKSAVLYMANTGAYEIKDFGDITLAYSDTPGPDYNIIFNYNTGSTNTKDFQHALAYSQQKRYPFMLIRDEDAPNLEIIEIMSQFHYKKVGTATKMALSHANINFDNVELPVIKEVNNDELLDIHCAIVDESFGRPTGSSKLFVNSMKNLLQPDSELKLYLAYSNVKGKLEPVAAAMLYLPKDKTSLAGHYAWAVKPEFRKKGIMTNFVKKMILIAQQYGYSASVAQCYDASVRLAERVGFKKYGDLDLYVNVTQESHQ